MFQKRCNYPLSPWPNLPSASQLCTRFSHCVKLKLLRSRFALIFTSLICVNYYFHSLTNSTCFEKMNNKSYRCAAFRFFFLNKLHLFTARSLAFCFARASAVKIMSRKVWWKINQLWNALSFRSIPLHHRPSPAAPSSCFEPPNRCNQGFKFENFSSAFNRVKVLKRLTLHNPRSSTNGELFTSRVNSFSDSLHLRSINLIMIHIFGLGVFKKIKHQEKIHFIPH